MITVQFAVHRLPTHPERRYPARPLRRIRQVVIHHSVTECAGTEPPDELQHLRNIARGHIRIRDWPGIAYHYCIFPTGRIYQVNHLWAASYHAGNYNQSTIGLCLIGKLHKHEPTAEQLAAAAALVQALGYSPVPHKQLCQTACPGNWNRWGHILRGAG